MIAHFKNMIQKIGQNAILSGFFGHHRPWQKQIRFSWRRPVHDERGRVHTVDADLGELHLSHRLRGPGRRVILLLHGLMLDDAIWYQAPGEAKKENRVAWARYLAEQTGATILTVRYNTGLAIHKNGQQLAERLDELVASYRWRLRSVDIVGYSMGGLVARSALHQIDKRTLKKVRKVFYVASPHNGAYLEMGVSGIVQSLGKMGPFWTNPVTRFLDLRSEGIKDLKAGHIFSGVVHPPEYLARKHLPPSIPQYFLAGAVLVPRPVQKPSHFKGDGMVHRSSAIPDSDWARPHIEAGRARVIGYTNHFTVIYKKQAADQLLEWWRE